jgi:hypothetical protein
MDKIPKGFEHPVQVVEGNEKPVQSIHHRLPLSTDIIGSDRTPQAKGERHVSERFSD